MQRYCNANVTQMLFIVIYIRPKATLNLRCIRLQVEGREDKSRDSILILKT